MSTTFVSLGIIEVLCLYKMSLYVPNCVFHVAIRPLHIIKLAHQLILLFLHALLHYFHFQVFRLQEIILTLHVVLFYYYVLVP